ncbi:MAG: DUF983 domain-containing protein [Flavobacteriales bacterium]|nr:DUF983 domain-containing protein [Flavobacteriales bacterium]
MKNSRVASIVKQNCPQCRIGKLFLSSAFNFRSFHKMNDKCDNCGQNFNPEPGFYMGAMYISYAFQVAIVVATLILGAVVSFELSFKSHLIIVGVLILSFFTIIFRLSRSIWIHICIGYKEPPHK